MSRRRRHFGRHLGRMPSALFLPHIPAICANLVEEGLELVPTTRPYLTQAGELNVRLVFRNRNRDTTTAVNFPLCGRMSDELVSALAVALGPHLHVAGDDKGRR